MHVTRDTLDILFRRLQPELLLDRSRRSQVSASYISKEVFQRYSYMGLEGFTPDEVENIYRYAQQQMVCTTRHAHEPENCVFYLLTNYTKDVLTVQGKEPLCKAGHLLGWRSISFRLGQDMFTTAYLALRDQQMGYTRNWFAWPAVIHCDDPRMRMLTQQGYAENHYHLNGSTRSLQISWVNLMNHPENIDAYFERPNIQERMRENLSPNLLMSADEHQMTWQKRLKYAAWFRVHLFRRLQSPSMAADLDNLLNTTILFDRELVGAVDMAKFQFGRKFTLSDGKDFCLDYAISRSADEHLDNAFNRILAGERALLYECFYRCFSGDFTDGEQNLFYAYLLLKSNFRGELIQTNRRTGFRNFLRYQDRKDDFYGDMSEYWNESYRLSINGAMEDSNITSLEARIMPGKTDIENYERILYIDREVLFAQGACMAKSSDLEIRRAAMQLPHFYVLHFAKKKLGKEKGYPHSQELVHPRNSETRARAKKQALALAASFSNYDWVCARVRGIDACSTEIGCRPETFATEFRFLRGYTPPPFREKKVWKPKDALMPRLSASYHAGEDFLDLADGLRAMDEAMIFCDLRRGDRIGHGMALGVEPAIYYSSKHSQIVLPKQDRLDDLVWLLYRPLELAVDMPTELRTQLTKEANQLFSEVYGESLSRNHIGNATLQDYYYAWYHRGDHPSLYWSVVELPAKWDPTEHMLHLRTLEGQYEMFYTNDDKAPACTAAQRMLLHLYHYGKQVREEGSEIIRVYITEQYAQFIREVQDGLQSLMADRGIGVECNPSSNVLIGAFSLYKQHPIFRFNRYGLNGHTSCGNELHVSVNTDDQGIFDTSLENEYALLANALAKQRTADGKRLYGDDAIYCYLEHLQELSKAQIFPPTQPTHF